MQKLFDPTGPLAFFAYTYVRGGGAQRTVHLVRELGRLTNMAVIDVYGGCTQYMADLERIGVSPFVLYPAYPGQTAIGGSLGARRLVRMALSIPHILDTAARLGAVLREVKPRALWVDDEKALFVAWLAAPAHMPLAYVVRAQLPHIRPYCALAWRRVDVAMGVSKDCLRYLDSAVARTCGYAHRNLHVVHSGIDVKRTIERAEPEPRGLPAWDSDALRIAFPAVISGPLKGHEVGIRAVAQYIQGGKQAALWICGDVPPEVSPAFRDRMVALAAELGVQEHVHFLGWREDMLSVMARSDVVMLPSFTEGLPVSLLEAMALAKPILSTRVGGIPELVREGIDGLLVEPGDVPGLARALHTLSEPGAREQMGEAGRRRVGESFASGRQIDRFLSIMNAIGELKSVRGDWRLSKDAV